MSQMDNIKCIHCGGIVYHNSQFCFHCGKKLPKVKTYTEGNLEPFRKDQKWGYRDRSTGEEIIAPEFEMAHAFKDERAILKKTNKYAFIDPNGNYITPFKYDDVYDFKEGFAVVFVKDRCTFIKKSGLELTSFEYDDLSYFKYGASIVRKDGKFGLIDTKGEKLIFPNYDSIEVFSEHIYKATLNNKHLLINTTTKNITGIFTRFDLLGQDDVYVRVKENDGWKEYTRELNKIEQEKQVEKDKVINEKEGRKDTPSNKHKGVGWEKNKRYFIILSTLIAIIFILAFILVVTGNSKRTPHRLIDGIIPPPAQDVEAWNIATSGNSIESYKVFIEEYPDSKYVNEAKQILEKYEWNRAIKDEDILQFKSFIQDHPNSDKVTVAQEYIFYLQALNNNTVSEFQKYLTRYPNGRFIDQAELKIRDIEWAKVEKLNSITGYAYFISHYPEDRRANIASRRLEPMIWNRSVAENTIDSYTYYLDNYPDGLYAKQAKAQIDHIKEWNEYKRLINSGSGIMLVELAPRHIDKRTGSFIIRRLSGDEQEGRYSIKIDTEYFTIRADRCTVNIIVTVGGHSEKITYNGRVKDISGAFRRQCGPVLIVYDHNEYKFSIKQNRWN